MSDDLAVPSVIDVQAAESHALALQALDALADIKTPREAEALLAKVKVAGEAARVMNLGKEQSGEWRRVSLMAERRWGELLGEAEVGRPAENVRAADVSAATGAEREAAREARQIAAVPEPVFDEYVEAAEQPSKAGLLRAAEPVRLEDTDIGREAAGAPRVVRARALHEYSKAVSATSDLMPQLDHIVEAIQAEDYAGGLASAKRMEHMWKLIVDRLETLPALRSA